MASASKNTLYYTIGTLLSKLASFFLLPIYANMLGASEYGKLSLIETASSILVILMTLATERSLYRLYYDYEGENRRIFLSTVFWTIILFGLTIFAIASLSGNYISPYVGNVNPIRVLIPVFLYTYFSAVISFSQIIMQVEQKGKDFVVVSLASCLFYNTFTILFLFYYSPTIDAMVYATLLSNLCVMPIIYKRLKRCIIFKFDLKIIRSVFQFSMPMFGMVAAGWALSVSDRFFIANLGSLEDAGVYSIAAKFTLVGTMLSASVFQAYGPLFYNITNTTTYQEAKKRLYSINKFISSTVCILFVLVALFSKIVPDMLLSSEYEKVAMYSYILCLAAMIGQQCGLLNLMIYQEKKTLGVSIIAVFAGFLSLILNIIFIPMIGSIGAAVCNLLVNMFIFSTTWILAKKYYYIKLSYGIINYSFLIIGVYYLVDIYIPNSAPLLSFLIKLLISLLWTYAGYYMNLVDMTYFDIYKNKIIIKVNKWRNSRIS